MVSKGGVIKEYLIYIKQLKEFPRKSQFIRELYTLSKKIYPELFRKTLKRALEYRIHTVCELKFIALELLKTLDSDSSPIIPIIFFITFNNVKPIRRAVLARNRIPNI